MQDEPEPGRPPAGQDDADPPPRRWLLLLLLLLSAGGAASGVALWVAGYPAIAGRLLAGDVLLLVAAILAA